MNAASTHASGSARPRRPRAPLKLDPADMSNPGVVLFKLSKALASGKLSGRASEALIKAVRLHLDHEKYRARIEVLEAEVARLRAALVAKGRPLVTIGEPRA